ncbi:MAG: hypothetical protein H6751_11525 [Candidatus Omnitrophica bacterium]|nr:hypothetical protein [Candidatus Omnitrophota bacterium]
MTGMNDHGEVVGDYESKDNQYDDYHPNIGMTGNAQEGFQKLEGVSGKWATATDINNQGQIVGRAYKENNQSLGSSAILNQARMILEGIGEILVGHPIHHRSDLEDSVALTWIDGELYRLEDMVEDKGDWLWLIDAKSINDRGQIVGNGIRKDTPRGSFTPYLLTPVEEGD